MIKSMTAFSRTESHTEDGHLSWEVRSVNHRYLETSFRLPEELRHLEPRLREKVRCTLGRGKLEITGKLKREEQQQTTLTLNKPLIAELVKSAEYIKELSTHTGNIAPTDILAWPNALISPKTDLDQLEANALKLFDDALNQLIEGRQTEGRAMFTFLEEKRQLIDSHLNAIKEHLPEIASRHREKLEEKIAELNVKVDQDRLEQELLFILQKSDVAEEVDRLEAHSVSLSTTLKSDKPVGRRLDFLLQEINREINTIGSKASDTVVTPQVVELKVLAEQIREQIQNIE